MALPLAPIAGLAVRYGAVALATYAVSRSLGGAPRDQQAEDAHDRADEGVAFRREAGQTNGTARFRRTIRLGTSGPGVEIDASALGRVKFRRV